MTQTTNLQRGRGVKKKRSGGFSGYLSLASERTHLRRFGFLVELLSPIVTSSSIEKLEKGVSKPVHLPYSKWKVHRFLYSLH